MKPITDSDREDLITMIEDVFSRMDDGALFSETEIALSLVIFVLKGSTLVEAQTALNDSLEKANEAPKEEDDHYSGSA